VQDKRYFEEEVRPYIDGEQIRFIGPVGPRERDELLGQARTVLHLNTIGERFGLVLAEAMAVGAPVIAMDLGSCREVVADGETGLLVNSVDEAVEAVERVGSISRRKCRERVEEKFTVEKMVEGYEKVYEEIFRREAEKEGRR
jgi:glycosyltransferase involved in cell wall biosynthesis